MVNVPICNKDGFCLHPRAWWVHLLLVSSGSKCKASIIVYLEISDFTCVYAGLLCFLPMLQLQCAGTDCKENTFFTVSASHQQWKVLEYKNTRNSAVQWRFLLCLNISCILSTCVCAYVSWVVAACHSVSGMFCKRGHWQAVGADIIAAHLPLRGTMWVFTNTTSICQIFCVPLLTF